MIGATWRKRGATSAAWLNKWQGKYPKLCKWVEDNIEETLAFHCLPQAQASEESWRNTTAQYAESN